MAEYVHNAIIALHNIDSALFHALQNKIRLNMSPYSAHSSYKTKRVSYKIIE